MLLPFSDSKFLLIGNGPSATRKKVGKLIDEFDGIVVRFNDYKIEGYEAYVGTRTDMWSTVHPYNKESKFSIIIYLTGLWDEDSSGKRFSDFRKLYKKTPVFQINPEISSKVTINNRVRLRFGACSSGASLTEILTQTNSKVFIYGFDFFNSDAHHYGDTLNFSKRIHDPKAEEAYFRYLIKEGSVSEFATAIDADKKSDHPCMFLLSQTGDGERDWIRTRFPGNIEEIEDADIAYSRAADLLSQNMQVYISGYDSHDELQQIATSYSNIKNIPPSSSMIEWYHWVGNSLDNKTVLVIARDPAKAVSCLSDYGAKSIDTYILGDHEEHRLKDIKAKSYDCVMCLESLSHVPDDSMIISQSNRIAKEKIVCGYELSCNSNNDRIATLHKVLFDFKFDELWLGNAIGSKISLAIEKKGEDYWDHSVKDWTKSTSRSYESYPIIATGSKQLSQSVLVRYK